MNQDDELRDEVLVLAAVLGNLDAFNQLVSRYRPAVVRTARAIVGSEHAEDVAQDALLLAFKALPSLEDPEKFPAWLSAITRNRAMRYGKRETSRASGRVEMDELLIERISAISSVKLQDLHGPSTREDELGLALGRINADYALALRLRFFDDMPLKRIAGYMGLPVSTIKWRLHQGKKLLREEIERLRKEGELWKERKK